MQAVNLQSAEKEPISAQPSKPQRFEVRPKGSWKQLVGWNKECTLQEEALKLGAEWRARENQREE